MQSADATPGYWQRLSYRWFVEYNPLYLLSAALVLGGVTLVTRGLANSASAFELVGVGAIPELYAALLIAGAALLTRAGTRRPAVLLALIAILYQGDLTLHTETSGLGRRRRHCRMGGDVRRQAVCACLGVEAPALARGGVRRSVRRAGRGYAPALPWALCRHRR